MTTLTRILSSFEYGPDKMALLGTAKPELTFRNSCDIKSLVGVTCEKEELDGIFNPHFGISTTHLIQNNNFVFEQDLRLNLLEHFASFQNDVGTIPDHFTSHRFQLKEQIVAVEMIQCGFHLQMETCKPNLSS